MDEIIEILKAHPEWRLEMRWESRLDSLEVRLVQPADRDTAMGMLSRERLDLSKFNMVAATVSNLRHKLIESRIRREKA